MMVVGVELHSACTAHTFQGNRRKFVPTFLSTHGFMHLQGGGGTPLDLALFASLQHQPGKPHHRHWHMDYKTHQRRQAGITTTIVYSFFF